MTERIRYFIQENGGVWRTNPDGKIEDATILYLFRKVNVWMASRYTSVEELIGMNEVKEISEQELALLISLW